MRSVTYSPPGLIENLQIIEREIPEFRENECLIKVYYTAINRADTLQRKGLYQPPPGESDILGLEVAGVVHNSHSNSKWKKNDRVMALLGGGGNAEYVSVNEKHLIKIPDSMSFKTASAIPEVWLTAFQLIYWISSLNKTPNDNLNKEIKDLKVLVHAGASGVGSSMIQILKKLLNIETVFATCGSDTKKAYLENSLNVTKAFNYKTESEQNFHEHIMKLTNNQGVNFVFDCVGGSYWQKNLDSLSMDGELIIYGLLGGGKVDGDILARVIRKRISIKSTTLRSRSIEYKHKLIEDFNQKVLNHLETGKLNPIIDKIFDIEDIGKAHAYMESNSNIGKILLKVVDGSEETNEKLLNADL